jgi:ADP-heptose:LPS heptosyltransferase
MHLVTLRKPVPIRGFGTLGAGQWLCSDQNAVEICFNADRGSYKIEYWDVDNTQPSEFGEMLIIRTGAWGDLLFLTPVLKRYREVNPAIKLTLSCREKHFPLFNGSGLVDRLLPYPLEVEDRSKLHCVVSLENVIENEKETHATDAMAKALGVEVSEHNPIYIISAAERLAALEQYPRITGFSRVCIQPFASVANRNYIHWPKVIRELSSRGWEIWLTGTPEQMRCIQHDDRIQIMDKPFRETAAFLNTCDAFCGVDSVWLHMAGALDIPAVGLFGPVNWKSRTRYSPNTTALTGSGDCAGCNWYIQGGQHFPPDGPCRKVGYCTVLADITPERIVSKVDSLRRKP